MAVRTVWGEPGDENLFQCREIFVVVQDCHEAEPQVPVRPGLSPYLAVQLRSEDGSGSGLLMTGPFIA